MGKPKHPNLKFPNPRLYWVVKKEKIRYHIELVLQNYFPNYENLPHSSLFFYLCFWIIG